MGKANGNVKLVAGFSRQFCRNMLTVGGRAPPDVHCNIENPSPQHAYQLGLCRRRKLEMQPAQRARPFRAGLVVLDEAAGDADVAQPLLVEGFAEPATGIHMPLGSD